VLPAQAMGDGRSEKERGKAHEDAEFHHGT